MPRRLLAICANILLATAGIFGWWTYLYEQHQHQADVEAFERAIADQRGAIETLRSTVAEQQRTVEHGTATLGRVTHDLGDCADKLDACAVVATRAASAARHVADVLDGCMAQLRSARSERAVSIQVTTDSITRSITEAK